MIEKHDIGASVKLYSVRALAKNFRITDPEARRFLADLGVPTIVVARTEYFSLFALEQALFRVLQPSTRSNAQLQFEMGLAGLMYSAVTREALEARLEHWGKRIAKSFGMKAPKGPRPRRYTKRSK